MPQTRGRIGPLDTFRFLTVTFALLSHALLEFQVEAVVSEQVWLTIRSITRTATPCLLFLFGVMGEVVYARRYREMGGAVRPRLYHRAFQCYVAFVVLAALVAVARPESLGYFISSFAFLKLEGYNIIFALYFFLLLLMVMILPVRERWGFGGLAALVGLLWLMDAVLLSRLPQAPASLSTLADVTVGLGGIWGPSTFHSVTLVVVGMVFGSVLYRPGGDRKLVGFAVASVALSLMLVALEFYLVGIRGFFVGIVDFSYRAANHPAYFAYGILGSLVTVAVAHTLYKALHRRVVEVFNAVGARTFSYFFLGNVLLILAPPFAVRSVGAAIILVGGFLFLSGLLTMAWWKVSRRAGIGAFFSTASYGYFDRGGAGERAGGTAPKR